MKLKYDQLLSDFKLRHYVLESRDGGVSWGKPKVLFKGPPYGPFVRNQMLFEHPEHPPPQAALGPPGSGSAGSAESGGGTNTSSGGAWLMPFYYTPNGYSKFIEHFSVGRCRLTPG